MGGHLINSDCVFVDFGNFKPLHNKLYVVCELRLTRNTDAVLKLIDKYWKTI